MKLRKYIPFLGGVMLFMVALWASNGDLSLKLKEALADSECTPNGGGHCVEIVSHYNFQHLNEEPSDNPEDKGYITVVYRTPDDNALDYWVYLRLKKDGAPSVELEAQPVYRTGGDYEEEFFGFEIETDDHDFSSYTVYPVLKQQEWDEQSESWIEFTRATGEDYVIEHPKFECNDGVDNDEDGKTDFGGGNSDEHCIHAHDDSEDEDVECSNGEDDDHDGSTDLSDDACPHYQYDDETDDLCEPNGNGWCVDAVDYYFPITSHYEPVSNPVKDAFTVDVSYNIPPGGAGENTVIKIFDINDDEVGQFGSWQDEDLLEGAHVQNIVVILEGDNHNSSAYSLYAKILSWDGNDYTVEYSSKPTFPGPPHDLYVPHPISALECEDGIDNDLDGDIDYYYPLEPLNVDDDCSSSTDDSEESTPTPSPTPSSSSAPSSGPSTGP